MCDSCFFFLNFSVGNCLNIFILYKIQLKMTTNLYQRIQSWMWLLISNQVRPASLISIYDGSALCSYWSSSLSPGLEGSDQKLFGCNSCIGTKHLLKKVFNFFLTCFVIFKASHPKRNAVWILVWKILSLKGHVYDIYTFIYVYNM